MPTYRRGYRWKRARFWSGARPVTSPAITAPRNWPSWYARQTRVLKAQESTLLRVVATQSVNGKVAQPELKQRTG
jgi:hypothetical protein